MANLFGCRPSQIIDEESELTSLGHFLLDLQILEAAAPESTDSFKENVKEQLNRQYGKR